MSIELTPVPVTARLTLATPGLPDNVVFEHVIDVQPDQNGDIAVDVAEVLRQMLDETLTEPAPQAEHTGSQDASDAE